MTPAAARTELERRYRLRVRADFATFCDLALPSVAHDAKAPAAHQRFLIRELQWLADTPNARLMVFMPPGSAKSTYCSVLFPAWMLVRTNSKMIGASHTGDLADMFSGRVQNVVREHAGRLGYDLKTEAKARWRTTHGCEYVSAGVGKAIAGIRADLAVIDDPVKSAEAADSEVQREAVWQWYDSDLTSRLKPGARRLVVMTRWHMDDLAGRILEHQSGSWRVVSLPAIAGDDDQLGRQPGEYLWNDDAYGFGALLQARHDEMIQSGSARRWSALYQQEPRPAEGLLFQAGNVTETTVASISGRSVRAWDLAATVASKGDPDWTCGVKLRRTAEGTFVIEDVVRMRGGPEQVESIIKATAVADGMQVPIGLPQDPGQAGKSQVLAMTRMLTGWKVLSSPETGSKETRASPFASQVNGGNVSMVKAPWNAALIEELRDFPTGRKDDQVDALSRAFAMLIAAPAPARMVTIPHMGR